MLTDTSDSASPEVWVEIRVDDGSSERTTTYIGTLRQDLLDAWTRIEHGECWFHLRNVLWQHVIEEGTAQQPEPTTSRPTVLERLMGMPPPSPTPQPTRYPEHSPLISQTEKAKYWGYTNDLYVRLDRVFRIMRLTDEYVEAVVHPALELHLGNTPPTPDSSEG